MVSPVPTHRITTAFGARGYYWSCNEDSRGRGIHTGVDYSAPIGTPVVAAIAGTIRHRSYGRAFGSHQFAISPSPGQPFANDEVFYAHCRSRLPDGMEVQVGQRISEVGAEGNVTGPHLHFEYHSGKNLWSCSVMRDPAVVIAHAGGGGPVGTTKIYLDKLKYGQKDSDSVKELQRQLNKISLRGGQELPITGNYGDMTDQEVRLWQAQIVGDTPDPPKQSFLGPKQARRMFPSPPYTIINPNDGDGGTTGKPSPPAIRLPESVWDPIQRESDGVWLSGLRPFKKDHGNPKIVIHTTETAGKPNWSAQGSGIPHITYERTGRRWQHIPFDMAAYTLKGGDYQSPNSDCGRVLQVEIIGFAKDSSSWSDQEYALLRKLLIDLCAIGAVRFDFPLEFVGQDTNARVSLARYAEHEGIVGHQHIFGETHWDPGKLDVSRLVVPVVKSNDADTDENEDWALRQVLDQDFERLHRDIRDLNAQ